MPIRKESKEDKWMKENFGDESLDKITGGDKGSMICQSCGCDVLAKPNDEGKIVCPVCKGICRGIVVENKEII